MSDVCVVLCTCSDMQSANKIATALVQAKLAACVNLIPQLVSIYRWQGELQQDNEVQMLIKTQRALTDAAFKLVKQHHPYDTPEWLVLKVDSGSQPYLQWIAENTRLLIS